MQTLKPHPRPTESKAEQNLQDIHMLIKVLEMKTSVYSLPIPVYVLGGGSGEEEGGGGEMRENEGRKVKGEEGS